MVQALSPKVRSISRDVTALERKRSLSEERVDWVMSCFLSEGMEEAIFVICAIWASRFWRCSEIF